MTSSMGIQLTPGQRCLLDLLQRKLLNTIQSYAKLSIENRRQVRSEGQGSDNELLRLKEKIRRISARQKRFTLEIINGNGNNTIPKESFFEALGLVTKEALSKLNSKTNERRRRTTANPRFSHEAIQAKRALEPLQKRLEPRVRDNKREASSRKPQRNQPNSSNNIDSNGSNGMRNNATTNDNNIPINNGVSNSTKGINNNQQALNNNINNNIRTSSRSNSSRQRQPIMHASERQELLVQFGNLQKQINSRVNKIKDKRESNKKLERQNERIRKRGLDIINAINMINPNLTFQAEEKQLSDYIEHQDEHQIATSQRDQTLTTSEPLDIWIDMKCDESLDGLD